MTRDFSTKPRRPLPLAGVLWVGVGAVTLLASTATAVRTRAEWSRVQRRVTEAGDELDRLKERGQALQAKKWPGDDVLASQIVLEAEAPPAVVLAAIEKVLPPDVRMQSLSLGYGRQTDVEMHVVARRPEAYDEFLARLGRAAAFRNVVPGAENREGEVKAIVKATFGGAP